MAKPTFSLPVIMDARTTKRLLDDEVNRYGGLIWDGTIVAASDPTLAQQVRDDVAQSAADAQQSAADAALYDGPRFDTVTDFFSSPATQTAGTIVRTDAEGFAYRAVDTATASTVANTGGQAFEVLESAGVVSPLQASLTGSGPASGFNDLYGSFDSIELPAGYDYTLTEGSIEVGDGQSLIGRKGVKPIIRGDTVEVVPLYLPAGSNQILADFRVTQDATTADSDGGLYWGIDLNQDYFDLTVDNLSIERTDAQAIAGFGVHTRSRFTGIRIFQTGRAGMVIQPAIDNLYNGNMIFFTGDDGIAMNRQSRNTSAIGNRIHAAGAVYLAPNPPTGNNGQGSSFKCHGQNTLIAGNVCTNAHNAHIALKPVNDADPLDPEDQPDRLFVRNNIFDKLASTGGAPARDCFRFAASSGASVKLGSAEASNNYADCRDIPGTRHDFAGWSEEMESVRFLHETVVGARYVASCPTKGPDFLHFEGGSFRFGAQTAFNLRAPMDRLMIDGGDYYVEDRPDTNNWLIQVTDATVGRIHLKGVRLWGDFREDRALVVVLGTGVVSELVLEDCWLNGVPNDGYVAGGGTSSVTSVSTRMMPALT